MRNGSAVATGVPGSGVEYAFDARASYVEEARGENLKRRTRALAVRVIRLVEALPRGHTADVIGKQVLRCATSVGANYRAACRARSRAEFVAKMGIVEEEADETLYWLDLLVEADLMPKARIDPLAAEMGEVLAIVVACIRTARRKPRT